MSNITLEMCVWRIEEEKARGNMFEYDVDVYSSAINTKVGHVETFYSTYERCD
jgi:hypothetical protein